ncbi:hypothetical protein [Escherichia coli]|uniref:hypothetical protein n=1 Tax=Escherichia coli TaxID=562 RepID=UPI003D76A3D5
MASGEYYWNSGMIPVPCRTLSRRTEKISSGYARCLRKSDERRRSGSSILFAWMKKRFSPARKSRWITRSWNVRQMPCRGADGSAGDVGSWSSLWEISAPHRGRQRLPRRCD